MRSQQVMEANWRAVSLLSLASFLSQSTLTAQEEVPTKPQQILAETSNIAPVIEQDSIVTIDGRIANGSIVSKNQDSIFIATADGSLTAIPTTNILKLRVVGDNQKSPSAETAQIPLVLLDGSRILSSQITFANGVVKALVAGVEEVSIPLTACQSMRINTLAEYGPAWQQFSQKTAATADLLAVRRPGGVLDTIEGRVKELTTTHLVFNYDGEDLTVPLAKLEGLLLYSRARDIPAATALVSSNGQHIMARQFSFTKEALVMETVLGLEIKLPRQSFEVDYSVSKAKSLKDLQVQVKVWDPLKGYSADSFINALLQPQELPVEFAISKEEMKGELQLKVPVRKDFVWFHGRASSILPHGSQIIFLAEGTEVLNISAMQLAGEGQFFSIPLAGVHELSIEISPGSLVQLHDSVFIKKE